MFALDVTGIPEVVGTVASALAGGWVFGDAMSNLLNKFWP